MSWHNHHLAHSTNRNTARAAMASEQILDGQRRAQLERAGLIDFNAPDGVVRAVERRLATERGEPVRKMYDVKMLSHMAGWGLAVAIIAGIVAATAGQVSVAAGIIGGLLLIAGFCSASFGFAELRVSEQLHNDAKQLAAYEAARGRRSIEG